MVNPAKFLQKAIIWTAAIGFALIGAYAAAGFYLAPYLIRTQALPRIAQGLGIQLTAETIEFDPFALSVGFRGFLLKDKAGRELISVEKLFANLDGGASVRERKAVFYVEVSAPSVNLEREAGGGFNLMALVPPDDGQTSSILPFLLTRLSVEQGRFKFKDSAGKQPFTAVLDELTLNLENLGLETDRKASFDFSAKIASRESLSAHGVFSLSPLAAEGRLEASGMEPASLINDLAPASPWRLKSGKLGLQAEYRFHAGNPKVFEIRSAKALGENLEAAASVDDGSWLKIAKLSLQGISYALEDQCLALKSVVVENAASPWLKISNLKSTNLSYALADQRLNVESATADNATSSWLKVSKLSMDELAYDLNEQSLNLKSAALSQAVADMKAESKLSATIENSSLATYGSGDKTPVARKDIARIARIGDLNASDVSCSFKQRSLKLGAVFTEGGEIGARRTAEGVLQVLGLPNFATAVDANRETAAPWTVQVGEFWLNGYAFGFLDESADPPVRLSFASTALRMEGFTTEPGRKFLYRLDTGVGEKGKIAMDGQAQLFPLHSELSFGVDNLWLRSLQPYWQGLVGFDLGRGKLNMSGDLVVRQDRELALDYTGAASIVDLAAVDRKEGRDLIRWKSLKLDGLAVGTLPRRVSVRTVSAEQPYAWVHISEDGELNLVRDLFAAASKDKPLAKEKPRTPSAESWPMLVGDVHIKNGLMHFIDQTLKPNFAVEIENLNGNIRGFSSQENAKADLFMQGIINRSSPVKIYGQAVPARFAEQTDIAMEFRGLSLTTLTPYTVKFAGYRVEKGKLDLDLRYKLKERRLDISNRMVLNQLTLGERVESPSATTLPVDLAVALLKDSDGQIDIDLPVSGNLDDPQFSLGSLYARAAEQLIIKVVGSPFSLLGNLMKSGGEDMGYVKFRPGDASLDQDEKSKLAKVAAALKQRPALDLDIKGTADPGRDRLALAELALLKRLRDDRVAELRSMGQRVPHSDIDKLELSDEDYRRLFTRYYRQKYPEGAEKLMSGDGGAPMLAGPAFDQARRKALDQWPVSELELQILARTRSLSIRDYMVGEAGLPAQRIYILDVNLKPTENGEIKALLTLSGT